MLKYSKITVWDALCGQPIKFIQVAFNSELSENQWNDLHCFEIVPSHCFGASEIQTKNAPNFFGCWKVKYLWPILCLLFWGPEAMRGNNFKEKKVVPLIFTLFWIRSHLNKLDRLTPQDVYYLCIYKCKQRFRVLIVYQEERGKKLHT